MSHVFRALFRGMDRALQWPDERVARRIRPRRSDLNAMRSDWVRVGKTLDGAVVTETAKLGKTAVGKTNR